MKKIIITTGLHFLAVLACFGQTGAGNLLVGGSVQFNNWEFNSFPIENRDQSSFYNFQLQGGKLIRDNLALGLKFQHGYSKIHHEYNNTNVRNYSIHHAASYSGGPFIRKYVAVTDKLFFYGQSSSSLFFSRIKDEPSADGSNLITKSNIRGLVIDLSPGFTYLISQKVGLDLSNNGLSYVYAHLQDNYNTNSFNLGLDLKSLAYGLRFYFTR